MADTAFGSLSATKQVGTEFGAFDLLREQLEEIKSGINDCVARAAQAGNYDDVRQLIEQAEGLDRIMKRVDMLLVEFANLFGQSADNETPISRTVPRVPSAHHGSIPLVLKNKHCDARAAYDGGGVLVRSGSVIALNECESMSE